jgi:hypothetical protein
MCPVEVFESNGDIGDGGKISDSLRTKCPKSAPFLGHCGAESPLDGLVEGKDVNYDMCCVEVYENTWCGDKMSAKKPPFIDDKPRCGAISREIGEERTMIAITH